MGRQGSRTSWNDPITNRLYFLITNAKELATYLGCSVQAVNQWKLGASRPTVDNLCRIADFYGVTVDYLLARSEFKSHSTEEITALSMGLSEGTAEYLQAHKNWGDTAASNAINLLTDEAQCFWEGKCKSNIFDLLNYFFGLKYSAESQALSRGGNVFDPQPGGHPQGTLILDEQIIEGGVLVAINNALSEFKTLRSKPDTDQ